MNSHWWERVCPWSQDPTDEDVIERADELSVHSFNFNEFSDCFPTIAAIAPILDRPIKITGIAHTRLQECNRPTAMAHNLKRLGVWVEETKDSLTIYPFGQRPKHQ